MHMAKDGQVYFHRGLFVHPVKSQRFTTEPVGPLDGINKDVSGAKLLLTTISVYPVDCAPSLPPTHPFIHATRDITVAVKKFAQNPAVLASYQR